MNERDILEWMLLIFSCAFIVKAIVFTSLANRMRKQRPETPLGKSLLRHYRWLGLQALLMAILFFYFFTQIYQHDPSPFGITLRYRLVLYAVATANVLIVAFNGVELLRAARSEFRTERP